MISVLILTKNEEVNIAKCIRSVAWSDDIHVFDSLSTDRTVAIATELGAKITQRPFDNWSTHQNWGVRNIPFKYPWVLHLDADEVCDSELTAEIQKAANTDAQDVAFRMRRKDFFMNRWIKRSQIYPTWIVRLFRPNKIEYHRLINPTVTTDGPIGTLYGHLLHEPFSHGVVHWISRHNDYSTLEAIEYHRSRVEKLDVIAMFSFNPESRRKSWKHFAYTLPFRPALVFVYLYFLRLGFLDGKAGYYFSRLRSAYELMIDVKIAEYPHQRLDESIKMTDSETVNI